MGFTSRSKAAVFTVAGALVLCVGIVDALTGYEISVGFFYAAPVMLVTWQYGFWPGALLSIAAIVGMFIVDNFVTRHIPFPSNEFIPYWNTAIRLSYFILIVWILDKLRSALNREQLYARRDFLTGLANSLAFDERMRAEMDRARRYGHPVSVAYMDCDDFKQVNDRFGHNVGDRLLQTVAQEMQKHLRTADVMARMGGDEFAVILPETGAEQAAAVMRKLQDRMARTAGVFDKAVSLSIGIVTFLTPADTVDRAVQMADELMYEAKSSGKGKIRQVVFDQSKSDQR
jgi:diguanylate cyclase (GGDEF)-like protein